MSESIPHFKEISINGDCSKELCKGASLIARSIVKEWKDKELSFKVYTNGITNKLVGVYPKDGNKSDQILVRVYGDKTDLFIDRQDEKNNIKYLKQYDCGPTLHCSFANGICYSFIPGQTLTTSTVISEPIYSAVAKHMAKLHSIPAPPTASSEPLLFNKIKRFMKLLPTDFLQHKLLKVAAAEGWHRQFLMEQIDMLTEVVESLECPIVLCHNDILLNNVIWSEEKRSVSFIDFEYTAPNYHPFDIANHFAEFAGVDTVDYNLYPNEEFQIKWLSIYLNHWSDPCSSSSSDRPMQWWLGAVAVMTLCSHLFWGIWAFVQAMHSTIDFDFTEYGLIRLREFKRRKEGFLKLGEKAMQSLVTSK